MKKLFTILILFNFITVFSQTQTSVVTYSLPAVGGNNVLHIRLGNSLFYVYTSNGLVFQKNNLNGIPALIKRSPNVNVSISHLLFKNGSLYAIGKKYSGGSNGAYLPYIIAVDTANLNITSSYDYLINYPNISSVDIQDSKILRNGNILMAGSVSSYSVLNTSAWAMEISPATNGTVVYTNTLVVNASVNNSFNSFAEISNSTIMFSGSSTNSPGFMSKADHYGSNLIFNNIYSCSIGGGIVNTFSNLKKVIVHTYLNNSSNSIFKLDTNLALLSTTSQSGIIRNNGFNNTTSLLKVVNDKIYITGSTKVLDILDTSLTTIATRSFIVSDPTVISGIDVSNTNIFIIGSTLYDLIGLIKTDLLGNLSCSTALNPTNSTSNTTGTLTPFTSAVIIGTSNASFPNSQLSTVTHTVNCSISTNIDNYSNNGYTQVKYSNGNYNITHQSAITSVEIFDLTGKCIKEIKFIENESSITIDANLFSFGLYIVKIRDENNSEWVTKIISN